MVPIELKRLMHHNISQVQVMVMQVEVSGALHIMDLEAESLIQVK